MDFFSHVKQWINDNPGKATGAFLGFFTGILLLTFGFLKTLLIVLLVIIGLIVGKFRDDRVPVVDYIKSLFNRNR